MENLESNSVKQFNGWAKWYDYPISYWPFYFSNKKVAQLLNPRTNSSFLDVGCGTGILLEQLSKKDESLKLTGVDISIGMIEKARRKLANSKSCTLLVGSGNNLSFKTNTFDYVTCCTSLHHHPDTKKSIAEMYRVVKPNGKVLILDVFMEGIIRKANYWIDNILLREGKTFAYTREQMFTFFHTVGFHDIHQETFGYFKLITIGIK